MQLKHLGLTVAIAAGALSSNMAFGQSTKFSYVNNFSTQAEIDDFYNPDWIWDTEGGLYCGEGYLSSDLISITPSSKQALEFSFKGFAAPGEQTSGTAYPSLTATAFLDDPSSTPPTRISLSCENVSNSGQATLCALDIYSGNGGVQWGASIGIDNIALDQATEVKVTFAPDPRASSSVASLEVNSHKYIIGKGPKLNDFIPKTAIKVAFNYLGNYVDSVAGDTTGSACIDKLSLQFK